MATEEGARSYAVLLSSLEDGQLLVDLSTKLHELNNKLALAAENVGKAKGELTLKLKLSADAGGTVQVDGEILCKEPKPGRARSVLWLSKGNNLVSENPRQTKLPLREVPGAGPARDVPKPNEAPRSV